MALAFWECLFRHLYLFECAINRKLHCDELEPPAVSKLAIQFKTSFKFLRLNYLRPFPISQVTSILFPVRSKLEGSWLY